MGTSLPFDQQKSELRRQMQTALSGLSASELQSASEQVAQHLLQGLDIHVSRGGHAGLNSKSPVVCAYWPLAKEVNVLSLFSERSFSWALPRIESPDQMSFRRVQDFSIESPELESGPLGLRQPVSRCEPVGADEILAYLVPGLAFGNDGSRLGRGRGYYDRGLAEVRGQKIGVCLNRQRVPVVPTEDHDVRMNWIVTESGWTPARGRSAPKTG